ncbi:MAG: laccase domain-containing protein, partial [Candidatus Omnitrophica bacterium]|nr:laccase domain-containing protein [Candidatus Omnitrophota bacterium]
MKSSRELGSYFPSWILADTFDRTLDYSFPDGGSVFNEEQERFLRSYAEEERNNKIKECQNIKQVHGNEIVLIKKDVFKSELVKKNISQDRLKAADGIITDFVDLPILIRTADCVPVFLFDEKFKV